MKTLTFDCPDWCTDLHPVVRGEVLLVHVATVAKTPVGEAELTLDEDGHALWIDCKLTGTSMGPNESWWIRPDPDGLDALADLFRATAARLRDWDVSL